MGDEMASNIFKTIVQRKIDIFINTFDHDSQSIFKNVDDKLIHPGEYGMYREECFKELLRSLLNKDMAVSDGFIITSEDAVSTQCDILIYNSKIMPVIDNNTAKFFPIESVSGIGEIKSTLNKADFKTALVKMANNKKLFTQRKGVRTAKIPVNSEFEYPLSFLVCKHLDFNVENICFETIYEGIPREYWHNAILSVDDGCIIYTLDFKQCPKLKLNFQNHISPTADYLDWYYSIHKYNADTYCCQSTFIDVDNDDVYLHINTFITILIKVLGNCNKYDLDVGDYFGNVVDVL